MAELTVERAQELQAKLNRIMEKHPDADASIVWRTLLNLEDPPEERLRRALVSGNITFGRHLDRISEGTPET